MTTELVELRTFYSSPGLLLLARADGQPAGCVGVRSLTAPVGEVRRLFVRPEYRAQGLGRRLLEAATEQSRSNGLSRLVLTTLPTMTEALMLYEAQGYRPADPYVAQPIDGVQYLARDL